MTDDEIPQAPSQKDAAVLSSADRAMAKKKSEEPMFKVMSSTNDDRGRRVEQIKLPQKGTIRYKGSAYEMPNAASLAAFEAYAKDAIFVRSSKLCHYVAIWPKPKGDA